MLQWPEGKHKLSLKFDSVTVQLSAAHTVAESHAFGKTRVHYTKSLLSFVSTLRLGQ